MEITRSTCELHHRHPIAHFSLHFTCSSVSVSLCSGAVMCDANSARVLAIYSCYLMLVTNHGVWIRN
jgi:hypothetical protein